MIINCSKAISVWCGVLLLLSACAVGEDFVPPKPELDAQWDTSDEAVETEKSDAKSTAKPVTKNAEENDKENGATQAAPDQTKWWEQFHDLILTKLITQALERNYDLKTAAARIEEAEAGEAGTFSSFFPSANIKATGTRGTLGTTFKNHLDQSSQSGVDGSWDIDLFGGNQRRDEAADAVIEASKADASQTRLKLIEEVARNYVRLRGLQQQRILTERNMDVQRQTLKVTNAQFAERVATKLDVLRAQAQLNRAQSRIPQIQHEINVVLNRLATLLDDKASTLRKAMPSAPMPTLSASILRATPIDTIQSRPDVKSAEYHLAQSTALTGAALADFFPKISLQGFFGRSDSHTFGYQSPWNATVNGVLPILNWGQLVSQYDIADARQKQALYTFQQTVLASIEDVEVAYSAYQHERGRKQILGNVADEQAQAVEVARVQYENGIVPQLDLLDAEQNLLDAQTNVVQSEETVLENAISLYTALGVSEKMPEKTEDVKDAPAEPIAVKSDENGTTRPDRKESKEPALLIEKEQPKIDAPDASPADETSAPTSENQLPMPMKDTAPKATEVMPADETEKTQAEAAPVPEVESK